MANVILMYILVYFMPDLELWGQKRSNYMPIGADTGLVVRVDPIQLKNVFFQSLLISIGRVW